jgi:hypothetical protein
MLVEAGCQHYWNELIDGSFILFYFYFLVGFCLVLLMLVVVSTPSFSRLTGYGATSKSFIAWKMKDAIRHQNVNV